MVQLIIGKAGKGKTKALLEKVNEEIKTTSGNIVFLDRSSKHMFDLNNKVRLVDVSEYDFASSDEFVGFICGIISQNHDIQQIYIDGFVKAAAITPEELTPLVVKLEKISSKFNFDLIASVSCDESEIDKELMSRVIISL